MVNVNPAAFTVRFMLALAVIDPEVPVIVNVDTPEVAVPLLVNVIIEL